MWDVAHGTRPFLRESESLECPVKIRAQWRSMSSEGQENLIQALKQHFYTNPELNISSVDEYLEVVS